MRIAINGAGVAGPALAFWLRRDGHRITLIEKAPRFRTGGYIIDFWGVGYEVAERMGLLPDILRAGYSVEEVRLVDDRGRKVGGFSTGVLDRMTNGRFTSLPRGDLAAAIYRAVEDEVETIFGDSISSIEEHDAGLRVGFERQPERAFDLVIGADGLHSRVRDLVFGQQSQFERSLGYRVAAFEAKGYRPRDELVYVSRTRAGRQVARFSERDDRTMFMFVFADERLRGRDPETVDEAKALLREVYGDAGWECPQILDAMDRVEDIYFDRVSQIEMDRWSCGRVMLIGDAASCVSLLAGEGTGLALTEAYVLAGELARANGDYPEAFRRHEQRLRPFLADKQKSARNFAASFAPRTRAGVWLRNRVSRLMEVPAVADWFIGRDLRDDFSLPDYGMRA